MDFLHHQMKQCIFLFFVIPVRHHHIKDQIDLVLARYHTEIMNTCPRIGFCHNLLYLFPDLKYILIFCLDRIHVDQKVDSKIFSGLPLDPVDDLVGNFDIDIIWYFRMDGRHAPSRSVIMYQQIVCSDNAVVGFHKSGDFIKGFLRNCFPDQWFQCIFCDSDSGPHDNKCHADSDETVDIDPCHTEKQH